MLSKCCVFKVRQYINKLNNIEQNTCDGLLNEKECKIALKEMKNNNNLAQTELQQNFIKYFGMI